MSWSDEAGASPFDKAPAGLRQEKTSTNWEMEAGASPWLRPAWETGGQVGTTANAFNEDFYRRMYDQYDEEKEKADKDPDYVSNLFLRDDFTGIVGWDQEFKPGNSTFQVDRDRTFRVGDVYDEGDYLGNVYDSDSGLSLDEANAMIAPHIFGDKAGDVYKEARGDQEKLKELILAQGAEQGKMVDAYITRQPYMRETRELLDDWEDSGWDEAAIVGGGILGGAGQGAALGASIGGLIGTAPGALVGGVVGGAIGAILGGVGSGLNMDEARYQAASSIAATNIVGRDTSTTEATDAAFTASKWIELVFARTQTFGNLVGGLSDIGNQGDNISEVSRAAGEGDWGAAVWKGVGGLADGIVTGGSGVNAVAYSVIMGSQAGSTAVAKSLGDGEWDEMSGSFHKYESTEARFAAAGSSTIDVAQSLLPSILRKNALFGIGGKQGPDLSALGTPGATARATVVGRQYLLENQGGKIVATAALKRDLATAWLAPSTFIEQATVRGMAQAAVLKSGGVKVTANDLYQAAARLEYASIPWKMALVNGFGESAEEVVQAYLNGVAIGYAPSQEEVVNAAIAGFSMGAGMSIGSRIGSVRQDQRMKFRADTMAFEDGLPPYSNEEWKSYSHDEKVLLSTPNRATEKRQRLQQDQIKEEIADLTVSSGFMLTAKEAAAQELTFDQRVPVGQDSVEKTYRNVPLSLISKPSWTTWGSSQTVLQAIKDRLVAMQERVEDGDPRQEAQTLQQLQQLLAEKVEPLFRAYEEEPTAESAKALNQALKTLWRGKLQGVDPNLQKMLVELVFTRNPNDQRGSQQLLLVQVDHDMTMAGNHDAFQTSQTLSKLLGSDYDGDTIQHLARTILTKRSRRELRLGRNAWVAAAFAKAPRASTAAREDVEGGTAVEENTGELVEASDWRSSGKVPFADRSYEERTLFRMSALLNSNDTNGRDSTLQTFKSLVNTLKLVLGDYVRESTLDAFYANLTAGSALAAKREFYRALGKDAAGLDRLSLKGNLNQTDLFPQHRIEPETPVVMWIEDTIQSYLEEWRNNNALRTENEVFVEDLSGSEPARMLSDLRSTRPVEAQTIGQSNDMRTAESEPLRTRSYQAYGAQNSKTIDSEGYHDPDSFRDYLLNFYSFLTRLRAGSALEAMRKQGDEVLRRTRQDLRNLAQYYFPRDFEVNPEYAMMEVANMPFWQHTQAQINSPDFNLESSTHSKFNGTLAQALLRQHDDAFQAETPFQVDQVGSVYKNISEGQALIRLFGHVSPADIVTSAHDAAHLGSFSTINSLTRAYGIQASTNARQRQRDYWKTYASYKKPGPYQLIVDTITKGVDTELAHGKHDGSTNADQASGRLAENDRKFHSTTVRPLFEALARLVRNLGISTESTNQELIDQLTTGSRALDSILALFPAEMRVEMIMQSPTSTDPNAVVLMPWFYQILRSTNAEMSAFIYWNALFQAERTREETNPAPSNSWVALWNKLDDRAKNDFERLRQSSTDLQTFVNEVNRRFAFDRVPLLAWTTDDNLYDPASTSGGWQWAAKSAERRQAMRDAKEYLETRSLGVVEEATRRDSEVLYATQLLRMLDNEKVKSSKLSNALTGLQERINQGALFSNAALSPAATQQFLQFAWRGWDWDSANKGKAPHAVEPIGFADVRKDQVSHGSAFDQVFDIAVSRVSADQLKFNPQFLTRRLRIETNTGAEIDWNPGDVRSFLELFIADGGAYSGLLYDLINPIVYDTTPDNKAVARYLFPRNLQQLATTDFYDQIFNTMEGRKKEENLALKTSYVNSLTKDNGILRFQGHLALARTTGEHVSSELTGEQYARIQEDTGELISLIARLTPEQQKALRVSLKNASRLNYYESKGKAYELEAKAARAFGTPAEADAVYMAVKTRRLIMKRAHKTANDSDQALAAYLEASQRYVEALTLQSTEVANQAAVQTFKIDWTSEDRATATRNAIAKYISIYGPSMRTTLTGADEVLMNDYDTAPFDPDGQFKTFGNEVINEKSWDQLSQLVAMHLATKTGATRTPSNISSPELSRFIEYDPSWAYLGYMYLLSDSNLDAINSVSDQLKGAPMDVAVATKRIGAILNRKGSIGEWTPSIILQHQNIDSSLDTAASTVQIAVGGTQIKKVSATEIAATRTNNIVDIELARSYTVDADILLGSKNNPYDRGLGGDPWLHLNGGAVVASLRNGKNREPAGPVANITDANGNVVEQIWLESATWEFPNLQKPKGAKVYFMGTSHSALVEAVAQAKQRMTANYDSTHTMTVEFQMLHQDDKPATEEHANSVLFDGLTGPLDTANSLYGAVIAQNEGLGAQLQRQALDSIKGSLAILTQRMERGFENLDPTHLKQILLDMTETVMSVQIGPDLAFPDNMYRAVYRFVRDRVKIKGTRDGETVILSTEQYFAGEGNDLVELEVFTVSLTALETLNGSTTGSGYARHHEHAPTVGGDGEVWTGRHSPEQLQRLPELGKVLTEPSEVGQGLQQSGLTSTERYGSFQYKEWTYANQRYGYRAYEKFDATIQVIVKERTTDPERQRTSEINRENFLDLARTLRGKNRIDEATVEDLKQALGRATPMRDVRDLSSARSLADIANILAGKDGRLFVLDPKNVRRSDEGHIKTARDVKGLTQNQLAPDTDVVWFKLDNVAGEVGSTEWRSAVQDEVSYLTEHGHPVYLTHDSNYQAIALAEAMLFEGTGNYRKPLADMAFYRHVEDDTTQQSMVAAAELFAEGQVLPLDNVLMGIASDSLPLDDEAIYIHPEGDLSGLTLGKGQGAVPVDIVGDLSFPGNREFGARVQEVYKFLLASPKRIAYVAEQQLIGDGEAVTSSAIAERVKVIQPLLQKALDDLDLTNGFYRKGSRLEVGSLYALADSQGRLGLVRWGYEPSKHQLKEGLQAQKENGLSGLAFKGHPAADSLYYIGSKRVSSDIATVRGGTIERTEPDTTVGLRVHFVDDITLVGSKLVFDAYKATGTILPKQYQAKTKLFEGVMPSLVASLSGLRKKGATRRLVQNAQNAIAVNGWDAYRALANAMNIVDGHPLGDQATRWSREEWRALDESAKEQIQGRVWSLLDGYRIRVTNRVQDPQKLANLILSNKQVTPEAEALYIQARKELGFGAAQVLVSNDPGISKEAQAEQAYLAAALTFLTGVKSQTSMLIGAPGIFLPKGQNRTSYLMPGMLTEFIDINMRDYVVADMNSRHVDNEYDNGRLVQGWVTLSDWSMIYREPGKPDQFFKTFSARIDTTGEDHSELSEYNNLASTKDYASNQRQQIARAGNRLNLGGAVRNKKLEETYAAQAKSRKANKDGAKREARKIIRRQQSGIGGKTLEQKNYERQARDIVRGAFTPLENAQFAEDPELLSQIQTNTRKILDELGLTPHEDYTYLVNALIRSYHRAWNDPTGENSSWIDARGIIETQRQIHQNLKAGQWPTATSVLPAMHADLVATIARNGKWRPDGVADGPNKLRDMLEHALDTLYFSSRKIPAEAFQELDGLMLTYEKFLSEGLWPSSAYPSVLKNFIVDGKDYFVSSIDSTQQRKLELGSIFTDLDANVDPESETSTGGTATQASRRARFTFERTKHTGGAEGTTPARARKSGRVIRSEVRQTTHAWQILHATRTIVPQLNPLLWAWNAVDVQWRNAPNVGANFVTGQSVGWASRMLTSKINVLADAFNEAQEVNPDSRTAAVAHAIQSIMGSNSPYLDQNALDLLPQLRDRLLHDVKWRSMIAGSTRHRPDLEMSLKFEERLQRGVDGVAALQDVMHGMFRKFEVDAYIIGILDYERIHHPERTAEQVLLELIHNPLSYAKYADKGAHQQAINTISNIKGAKSSTLGTAIDRVFNPLAKSGNGILHTTGNVFFLLTKFRNFAISSGINMLGAQWVDAAGAIVMQGLDMKARDMRNKRSGVNETVVDYQSKILESADLANAFIRSGMSWTGLFTAAIAANALGLTGEDEEERRRRRARQLQGLGALYDPLDIANDFRNRGSIWLDGFNDTWLGALTAQFRVQTLENGDTRSPANLHWTLGFFVNPIIGVGEFLQSGNFADLAYRFESAYNSVPIINTNFFWDAYDSGSKLYEYASNSNVDNPEEMTEGIGFLVKTIGVFEHALLELSFVNELVAATDEYARAPWTKVDLNEDGGIRSNRDGQPVQTGETTTQLDENPDSPTFGQMVERPTTRSYQEGLIRAYTSNNQTAALIANLVTGQGVSGDFNRFNMATAKKSIAREELSSEDAETLILSVWDPENKQEVLTRDGAERLFASLHAGTVKASDPALQGIFISPQTRTEIADSLKKKIIAEGMDTLGLTEEDATSRMWKYWYGDSSFDTPLSDVIFNHGKYSGDRGISFSPTVQYEQLNTTWVQGPDGKFWATGIARHGVMGMAPLIPMYNSASGGTFSNLGVDEVLNATDELNQINTGMRALTRVNNNVEIPTYEDMMAADRRNTEDIIEQLKRLDSDFNQNRGYYGRGYSYGGGGGGGYAQNPFMPFLNGMRVPYSDNIPQIYINNINPRRASIRRERFSSERGRLNQQQ